MKQAFSWIPASAKSGFAGMTLFSFTLEILRRSAPLNDMDGFIFKENSG